MIRHDAQHPPTHPPIAPPSPAQAERLLSPFVPRGYDLYVLGVQEGVSDRVYEAIAAWTETFRLPLHTRFYSALVPPGVTPIKAAAGAYVTEAVPASGSGASASNPGPRVRISRKPGRAVTAQQLIDEARLGIMPEACTNTVDMLDRVWGRGDGAMLSPKFTGIAVFVAPVVAPYTRLLSVFKHSFGASEGSKGGVGVALGCYDVTMAFINCHMASKRSDMRRAQYCELVDRMGAKLGGRGEQTRRDTYRPSRECMLSAQPSSAPHPTIPLSSPLLPPPPQASA